MRVETMKYFDLENVKKALKNKIDLYKSFTEKWEQVTYNTKKDGSNFSKIEKNFNNLYFDDDKYDIYVYSSNYIKDYIRVITYLSDYGNENENEKLLKTHTQYGYDYCGNINKVYHTIDEIKQDIEKHIKDLQVEINDMIYTLENINENEIIKLLLSLQNKMKNMNKNDVIINGLLYYLDD